MQKLTRSILRFIGRYNFNSFCQIHTISNFYTHFHQDRRQFFVRSSISIVYRKSRWLNELQSELKMKPCAKLLYSSSKFYTVLNARTIRCNRTPTRRLKQHFSPTCRRLFDLSLRLTEKDSTSYIKRAGRLERTKLILL